MCHSFEIQTKAHLYKNVLSIQVHLCLIQILQVNVKEKWVTSVPETFNYISN